MKKIGKFLLKILVIALWVVAIIALLYGCNVWGSV